MADGTLNFDTKLNTDGVKTGLSSIGGVAKSALGITAGAIGAATTAVTGLVAASVKAYSSYEQLVGGVDTLFGSSSAKVQEYAANAYKTAGMSANQYMETVTGFSASLLQSLGGDTEKAAAYADQAVTDMSDNANKMGTDIGSIQNAYQGFAKQNYTMLDNLKLGYGGTKEEMQRLLTDAEKISGVKYDISSYADVTQAIHVMQEEMGIAGTTAKEASTTIEGSLNSTKAAWSNLVAGMADDNADMGQLIDNFVQSAGTAFENIMPRVQQAIVGVGQLVSTMLPIILQQIPTLINNVLPQLLTSGIGMIKTILQGVQSALPEITTGAFEIVGQLIDGIISMLPQLLEIGMQALTQFISGITQAIPTLLPAMTKLIGDMVDTLIENAPALIEAAVQLIVTLGLGLAQALPIILPQIINLVLQIGQMLIAQLPTILVAAMQMYAGLVQALPIIVQQIVAALPVLVQQLVATLVSNAPQILAAAIQLFMAIVQAIPQIVISLLSVLPQIVQAIRSGLAEALPVLAAWGAEMVSKAVAAMGNVVSGIWNKIMQVPGKIASGIAAAPRKIAEMGSSMLQKARSGMQSVVSAIESKLKEAPGKVASVGLDIVKGIGNGITNGIGWLKDRITSFVGNVTDFIKRVFKIGSPSKLMRDEVGIWLAKGIGVGFMQGMPDVEDMMNKAIPRIFDTDVSANLRTSLGTVLGGLVDATLGLAGVDSNRSIYNINISGVEKQSPDEIARAIRVQSKYGLIGGTA